MSQSKKPLPNFDDEVYVQAAEWIELLSERELDTITRKRLQNWLNADPNHRILLERMTVSWADPALLNTLRGINKGTLLQRFKFNAGFRQLSFARASLIAMVLVTVVATRAYYDSTVPSLKTEAQVYFSEYQTQKNQLSDGSTITQSGDSEIAVKLDASERSIFLKKGAAFFEVAHEPQRPFKVNIEDVSVTAVGTEFNIDKTSECIKVTVYEGSVVIQQDQSARPTPLQAGQQVTVSNDGTLSSVQQVNVSEGIDWLNGWVNMSGEPLGNLVEQLNRYSSKKIKVSQQSINELPVAGHFRLQQTLDNIEFISELHNLEVQKQGEHYLLSLKH